MILLKLTNVKKYHELGGYMLFNLLENNKITIHIILYLFISYANLL